MLFAANTTTTKRSEKSEMNSSDVDDLLAMLIATTAVPMTYVAWFLIHMIFGRKTNAFWPIATPAISAEPSMMMNRNVEIRFDEEQSKKKTVRSILAMNIESLVLRICNPLFEYSLTRPCRFRTISLSPNLSIFNTQIKLNPDTDQDK